MTSATIGEPLEAESADLLYIGGGQDRDQAAVAQDMAGPKRVWRFNTEACHRWLLAS